MEEQKEIQKQFRNQQEKFAYYIIGMSVTAIGFSVYKTTGKGLDCVQIPLALSVLCWGVSVFCGLKFLKYVISTLYANNAYFEIQKGNYPDVGNHPQKIEAATEGIKQAMSSNSDVASKYSKWQERLFYIGIVLFIIWHVLEMYKTTIL